MVETTIYVLWIDDKKDNDFIERLQRHGIHAHQELCYLDGLAWLRNKENYEKCDAVILDVKCKIRATDSNDSDESFKNYAYKVYGLCEDGEKLIPWFVFTAGTGYKPEVLENIPMPRWALMDKKYYSKGSDRGVLIEHIKQLTKTALNVDIRLSYSGLFDLCDEDANTRLLNVIKAIDRKRNYANTSVFNDIRKLMAYVVDYGKMHGLFDKDIITPNDARRRLGEISKIDPEIVPVYIHTTFHALAEIVNNGSHSIEENEDLKKLSVDKDVLNGDAPYLSRAALYQFATILNWCRSLPTEANAIKELSDRVTAELADPVNAYTGRVVNVIYENGYWHYGKCMVLPRPTDHIDESSRILIVEVEPNSNRKSNLFYPYFAKKYNIVS